jgi:hypothetical protein
MSWEDIIRKEEDWQREMREIEETVEGNRMHREEKGDGPEMITVQEFEWVVNKTQDHSLMIYLDRNGKEIPEEYSHIYTGLSFNNAEDSYYYLKDRGIKIIRWDDSGWKNYDGE